MPQAGGATSPVDATSPSWPLPPNGAAQQAAAAAATRELEQLLGRHAQQVVQQQQQQQQQAAAAAAAAAAGSRLRGRRRARGSREGRRSRLFQSVQSEQTVEDRAEARRSLGRGRGHPATEHRRPRRRHRRPRRRRPRRPPRRHRRRHRRRRRRQQRRRAASLGHQALRRRLQPVFEMNSTSDTYPFGAAASAAWCAAYLDPGRARAPTAPPFYGLSRPHPPSQVGRLPRLHQEAERQILRSRASRDSNPGRLTRSQPHTSSPTSAAPPLYCRPPPPRQPSSRRRARRTRSRRRRRQPGGQWPWAIPAAVAAKPPSKPRSAPSSPATRPARHVTPDLTPHIPHIPQVGPFLPGYTPGEWKPGYWTPAKVGYGSYTPPKYTPASRLERTSAALEAPPTTHRARSPSTQVHAARLHAAKYTPKAAQV